MVKAYRYNFDVPGFASSVVQDNEEEVFTDLTFEDTKKEDDLFTFHKYAMLTY